MATRVDSELAEAGNRIYQRDPQRFNKLVVWIVWALKHHWDKPQILFALNALDRRENTGPAIADWWPWLTRVLEWNRTRELVRENNALKTEMPNHVKVLMKRMFEDLR